MIVNRKLAFVGPLLCAVFLGQAPALVQLHAAQDELAPNNKGAAASHITAPSRALPLAIQSAPPSPDADADQTPPNRDNSNPYAIIVDRNVFRLVPPPPPPAEEKKPADVPTVTLSGLRKIGRDRSVYFAITPKDTKEQRILLSLHEGEKQGVLELVRIHPNEQEVDVVNSGIAMTLSFKSNSFASASAPPPGKGAPGAAAGRNPFGARMPAGTPPSMPRMKPFAPRASTTPIDTAPTGGGTVVAGAQPSAQSFNPAAQPQAYGATSPNYANTYSAGGNTLVAGAPSVNVNGANGMGLDLNPSVPARSAQTQPNWPPVIPGSEAVQTAALLVHAAAGGPPAPPVLQNQ